MSTRPFVADLNIDSLKLFTVCCRIFLFFDLSEVLGHLSVQNMTKRRSTFGLSEEFKTEYTEKTISEVQIVCDDGVQIMVSFMLIV